MKNILLVDIPTYKVFLNPFHKKIIKQRLIFQNLLWQKKTHEKKIRPSLSYSRGILIIASLLERCGYNVKYLNLTDPIDCKKIDSYVMEADIVGITVITPAFDIVDTLSKKIKSLNKKIKIILGGSHVSSVGIDVLKECHGADFGLIGSCAENFIALIENLNEPETIPGVIYRDGVKKVRVSLTETKKIQYINSPMPAYHLLNRRLSNYAHNIRTTDGCAFRCNFCYDRGTFVSEDISCRKPEEVIKELLFLSQHLKPKTLVHFSDAIFNFSPTRTSLILDLINASKVDLLFSCDTRADCIRNNLGEVKKLGMAGFKYLRMGFEDTDDNILNITNKLMSHTNQIEACEAIRSSDSSMAIHAYMIAGLPGSTRQTMFEKAKSMRNLVQKDLVDIIGNKIFVPYPGTPFFQQPNDFNITIKTKQWSNYDRRSFPVYELEDLSAEEIYTGYLFQEAILLQAYKDKLNKKTILKEDLKLVEDGLDYIFFNYT